MQHATELELFNARFQVGSLQPKRGKKLLRTEIPGQMFAKAAADALRQADLPSIEAKRNALLAQLPAEGLSVTM